MSKSTYHTLQSRRRKAQLGISERQISMARRYGRKTHQAQGRVLYFVGKKEVERAQQDGVDIRDCLNLAVVVALDDFVITQFRTANYRRARIYGLRPRRKQRDRSR